MKTAKLHRMIIDNKACPSGLKAKALLESEGYEIEEHLLETREAVNAFKQEHDVQTTPQVWIDDKRIGGHDDLRAHLGQGVISKEETSYQSIIAIFSMTALMALALSFTIYGLFLTVQTFEWFIALSVCFLAALKLQDIEQFATMFLNYDLLAQRWPKYAKIYPYAEALSGILMLSGALMWIASPLMLFIGTIGAYSVFKAVYLEKKDLKCACVGGDTNVPLGFVSLTENLMMMFMGVWMII